MQLWPVRLSAKSLPFQGGISGAAPLQATQGLEMVSNRENRNGLRVVVGLGHLKQDQKTNANDNNVALPIALAA